MFHCFSTILCLLVMFVDHVMKMVDCVDLLVYGGIPMTSVLIICFFRQIWEGWEKQCLLFLPLNFEGLHEHPTFKRMRFTFKVAFWTFWSLPRFNWFELGFLFLLLYFSIGCGQSSLIQILKVFSGNVYSLAPGACYSARIGFTQPFACKCPTQQSSYAKCCYIHLKCGWRHKFYSLFLASCCQAMEWFSGSLTCLNLLQSIFRLSFPAVFL